jgi:hypothetical protein
MIDVGNESAAISEFVAKVIDLADRIQDASIGSIHGVKRFEPEPDADRFGMGQQFVQGLSNTLTLS